MDYNYYKKGGALIMKDLKMTLIDGSTMLIVPINADIPLSNYIEYYNSLKKRVSVKCIIIDMLIYVGNNSNRFQYCRLENGKIETSKLKRYDADETILEKAYELFSYASIGNITRIFSPTIRNIILDKKMHNCY